MNRERFLEMANVGGIVLRVSDTEIQKLLVTSGGEPYLLHNNSRIFLYEHPESFIDEISGRHEWVAA
jgi:hypothetical protein